MPQLWSRRSWTELLHLCIYKDYTSPCRLDGSNPHFVARQATQLPSLLIRSSFFPKLDSVTHMPENRSGACLTGLLLALLFLFAQFHFCEGMSFDASSRHLCPACSSLNSAITLFSPVLSPLSVLSGILLLDPAPAPLLNSFRRISPRAPPAL